MYGLEMPLQINHPKNQGSRTPQTSGPEPVSRTNMLAGREWSHRDRCGCMKPNLMSNTQCMFQDGFLSASWPNLGTTV